MLYAALVEHTPARLQEVEEFALDYTIVEHPHSSYVFRLPSTRHCTAEYIAAVSESLSIR